MILPSLQWQMFANEHQLRVTVCLLATSSHHAHLAAAERVLSSLSAVRESTMGSCTLGHAFEATSLLTSVAAFCAGAAQSIDTSVMTLPQRRGSPCCAEHSLPVMAQVWHRCCHCAKHGLC